MARKTQPIEVAYKGKRGTVHTCLTAEQAAELRGRWPEGVIDLERLGDTPVLLDEQRRSWLVRTACRVLRIEDWKAIDREAGRKQPYAEHERPVFAPPASDQGGTVLELARVERGPASRSRARPTRARGGRQLVPSSDVLPPKRPARPASTRGRAR